ncbi:NAD-glutamate dehydrogenase [Jiangella ureilytica]|uniref:NAD-glutamate dehydrogenase n=1 Tax=Jiangella ureilytica TaxID=2530374 RepID=A0A4R4RCB9_9ACTN|nr:NAD-glutamate dehydrogenase [Jiangella ureilytica]TDC46784.1 NAD-glutamate dehydrogenase [Jiangella ureilytica]
MRNRLDEAKSELIAKAAVVGDRGSRDEDEAFLRRYYRHVAAEDLVDRDVVDVYGVAASHRRSAQSRPQGTAVVNVYTPTIDEHGWASGHTIVEVVIDDMPFLVDSVTMALAEHDHAIRLVVHPQLVVRRDITGQLIEVLDLNENDPRRDSGTIVESWMHVEIDRTDDPDDQAAIEQLLRDVLRDVREAIEDWPRMRQRAIDIADELEQVPSSIKDPEADEARELLRWLADDHFTFLGYREYQLDQVDGEDVLRAVTGTGLGVLRSDQDLSGSFGKLPREVRAKAREKRLLVLTKANSKATVHRPAYLDYVGVKTFDAAGEVVGERRFLGLFTSAAYTESVLRIPVLRRKVHEVIEQAGFAPSGHSGKDLLQVLETYPRDELFQIPVEELLPTALAVVHLQERRHLRMFIRRDDYGRYLSILVYLPRDRYNTEVRERIQRILLAATEGDSIDFTARVGESVLARLHFVIRMKRDRELPAIDIPSLEKQLVGATRSWGDELSDALAEQVGEEGAAKLLRRYRQGFPEGYKADFPARTAVADVRRLEELPAVDGLGMNLYQPVGGPATDRRFKIYRTGTPISLTQVLPILSRMGVEVVDERPYEIVRRGAEGESRAYIYDFGLRYRGLRATDADRLKVLFQDAFAAVWRGDAESDGFNALVPQAGLSWRQASILRAYAKYLRQAGTTFSQDYLEEALSGHVEVSRMLVDLFEIRFDPERHADDPAARADAAKQLTVRIEEALDQVASLDQDRILRSFLRLVNATLRTSYYRSTVAGPQTVTSFKLDSRSLPELPDPKPRYEIWVYSPRVEGVHLRFGAVARGGLRWSDRREDFRTEILGLVKAQAVKNSVIVPVGAKGGFVGKRLPDPAVDREAWLAEGVECYKTFIRAMLDITDNRAADRSVVPPPRVVRHDGDDPYLVVAADKGTAAFSDIANEVSKEYGFWLGDAFASGGSAGYDHKAMGITARGAWESVKRHFRQLGRDTQTEDFTVVGVGDMSGDVFGNGMLLSEHIRLVAAFDHRHVFLDPDPDPAQSYAERRRLFDLPRSSWNDYEPKLISDGGGVFPRTAKTIPLSSQVKAVLGIESAVEAMTPPELMHAILAAPVDLLWNGGIGTYVKASTESHAEVGDKANDAIRVDASDLRALVVGEGGNLGLTQRGRVEFALAGGKVNTDAIDNSAGVDTSDHEVNIKILLDGVVRAGDLTEKQRNDLLAQMTDEISDLVLAHNYGQNIALANATFQASNLAHVHRSFLAKLESQGKLDRNLEALPTDRQLAERMNAGKGLTGPELSVLLAYTKNLMYEELLAGGMPDDPYLGAALHAYFPSALRDRYGDVIDEHPLRREIITNVVVNELVNTAGTTFAYRLGMETGGTVEDLARAHTVGGVVFQIPELMAAVKELDNVVAFDVQTRMRLEGRTITERATRWLTVNRRPPIDIAWQIGFFEEPIARLLVALPDVLVGRERDLFHERLETLTGEGVPEPLAVRVAVLPPAYAGLGMVENSLATGTDLLGVARVHFTLGAFLELGRLLERIISLPRRDRWQTMARAALRDDLHAVQASLTAQVIRLTDEESSPQDRVEAWAAQDEVVVARAQDMLREIVEGDSFDLARLSVGLRAVRGLLRTDAT